MLVLLWFWILMMKSDAAEIITAQSGGAVQLITGHSLKLGEDVRWTHTDLVLSLKNNNTVCHHGRCALLNDGSLRFSRVQAADSGNYSLEVFDKDGKRMMKKDFLLRVEDISSSSSVLLLICILLLLMLLFIMFFILRRRNQRTRSGGALEENVYVAMHPGNKKDEEKLESHDVPCNPIVSMETPITEQRSVDVEDFYV